MALFLFFYFKIFYTLKLFKFKWVIDHRGHHPRLRFTLTLTVTAGLADAGELASLLSFLFFGP